MPIWIYQRRIWACLLAGAFLLPVFMFSGTSALLASTHGRAQWFGPMQNNLVGVKKRHISARRRTVRRNYNLNPRRKAHSSSRDFFGRNLVRTTYARRDKQPVVLRGLVKPGVRLSPQKMKRAFVGSYAPGYAKSPTPIFSPASLAVTLQATARYRAITQGGGWQRIPGGKALKAGVTGNRVIQVKNRLMKTGDYPNAPTISDEYDEATEQAVKRFQLRHGLAPDGSVGPATLRAMNVSAGKRLAQLEKNLFRLQQKADEGLPSRFVMVNIPDYRVEVVENGNVKARHNVVVGRASRQTNIIKANITQANFYPYWHVPRSIVVKDLLPRIRRGENVLRKMRLRIYRKWGGRPLNPALINWNSPSAASLKFRQEPGVNNALGMLRLNMPNLHAIYLHDTPVQSLLSRQTRAYSSGCVRVKDVFKLADWLLKDTAGWTSERIQATVRAGKSKTVTLNKPVPVYFDYITAWAKPDGTVQFRGDIYRRDGELRIASKS